VAVLHLLEQTPEQTRYVFFCPGCQCAHWVRTRGPHPLWEWNGDMERPTLSPSVLCPPPGSVWLVRDGKIEFLGDCQHPLAGRTVDLPDWDTL
jgi:Family of unknown function (DUF6527)